MRGKHWPAVLLTAFLVSQGCATAITIRRDAPIRNLGIYAAGDDALVEVRDIIQPGEEGAWLSEGRWTEVVLRVTNTSSKLLTLAKDIHLIDERGIAVAVLSEADVAKELQNKERADQASAAAGRAAISAVPYLGILGSIAGAAGQAASVEQWREVQEEFRRRAIPTTRGVPRGSRIEGSVFFNQTPNPQKLVLTYSAGGQTQLVEVPLTPGGRVLLSVVESATITTEHGEFRLIPGQPSDALEFATNLIGIRLVFSKAISDEELQNLRIAFSSADFPCGKAARIETETDRRVVRLSGYQQGCLKSFVGNVQLVVAGLNIQPITYLLGTTTATPAVVGVPPESLASAPVPDTPGPAVTTRRAERWAVVIGIDDYKNPGIVKLRYAAADAKALHEYLVSKGGFKRENTLLLLNKEATEANIRKAVGEFLKQKALKEDEVVIYYAGHGTTEPDSSAEGGLAKYLVPHDADPDSLYSTAIPMSRFEEVFGRIQARKILLIQDACFSGGAGTGARTFLRKGFTRSVALTDRFLKDLSQREGRMILTASDANQVSQESHELGHGIFTYYLLQGLKGDANLDKDGAITVRELHLYLQRKVHEKSGGNQTPQLYNIGDMALVALRPQ